MMNVELDLLTVIDQHLFIEEGIRGEVTMVSHQCAQANVPGMENYNVCKCNSYITYLDANNLYEWTMLQSLPTSNFNWLKNGKMKNLDVMMIPDDTSRGYIIECGLGKYYFYYLYIYVYFIKCNVSFLWISEYPRNLIKCNVSFVCISEYPYELHDLRKDCPLAPECLQIEENMLSDYSHELLQGKWFSKPPPKLVPNLRNKTNYIIHSCNLKLYLELGLCLTNVHSLLSFDQLPWLRNYITRQCTAAKNDFEKDIFKLKNKAVFGKLFVCLFVILCSYILIHSL